MRFDGRHPELSSRDALERWLAEFHQAREAGELIRVIVQDGEAGADTGLVIVPLKNATVSVFIEPVEVGDANWRITLEPQPEITVLSSHQLHALTAELAVAAELCSFLEAKSVGHDEPLPEA